MSIFIASPSFGNSKPVEFINNSITYSDNQQCYYEYLINVYHVLTVSVKSANEVIVNLGVGVTFGFSQSEDPVFSGDAAVEIIAPEIDEGDEDFGFKDVEHFDEGVVVGEGPGYF